MERKGQEIKNKKKEDKVVYRPLVSLKAHA